MTNILPMETAALDRRAERIRKLMGDMVGNTLAVGSELDAALQSFPVGPKNKRMGWKSWLRSEFNLSQNWASVLIRVHRKFGHLLARGHNHQLPSATVLKFLTKENLSAAAVDEVLAKKKVTIKEAKKIVRKHLPSPKKANQIARDTGKPTAASDGYVYLGASDAEVKESTERRTVVYAVREAVETIASIEITAEEFLEYALPHQLWKAKNEHQIAAASIWLAALARAWETRQ